MYSLNINKLVAVENLNHPSDYYIYFDGGYLVWNAANGPLQFWYNGELIQIENKEDIEKLRELIQRELATVQV